MAPRFLFALLAVLPLAAACMPDTPETQLTWDANDRAPQHVTPRSKVAKRYEARAPAYAYDGGSDTRARSTATGYMPRTYVYQEKLAPLSGPRPQPHYVARNVAAYSPPRDLTPPRETKPSWPAWQQVPQPDYQPDYEPKHRDDDRPAYTAPANGSVAFAWPLQGRVIGDFGGNSTGGKNDGIDIAVPAGTPIRAAASGSVTFAGDQLKDYGNLVLIKHPGGFNTAYAHADRLLVQKGDFVARGQVIGYAGQTGDVSRPQLHFEIRSGATPVNPRSYLSTEQARS